MSTSGPRRAIAYRALHHRSKTVVLGTVLASTALAGCTIDLEAIPAAALGALVPFNACADALSYLQDEGADRVGAYGLDQGGGFGWGWAADGAESADRQYAVPQAAPVAGSPTGDGYSGTNNQEAGVDEADSVKTDGEYIYTAVDGWLRVTDVRGGAPSLVGKLELTVSSGDGSGSSEPSFYGPSQLLLEGDTVLVMTTQPRFWADDASDRIAAPGWGGPGWSQSVMIAVDVSDPSSPRETARLVVDGDSLSARMIDGTARVVIRSTPMLPFEPPYSEQPDADWEELEAAAVLRNKEIVASSTIDQWLPSYTLDAAGHETSGQLVACENVSHPVDFSGFNTISVLTIPLADGSGLDTPLAASVLGDGEIVYASTDRLYVVTNRWESWDNGGIIVPGLDAIRAPQPTTTSTGIHAFDITGSGVATHVASGEVSGRVIGQYALSEQDGVLRVATTDDGFDVCCGGRGVAPDGPTSAPSESKITTLAERDGELVELGTVGGLGKGEQIYAVRYFGDTAYVVTFRQTDPLYVIDLADPANPRETGELEITGYSAYLHPLGEDRLIGVGQEATEEGRTMGLQVSLFDTSDATAPTKIDGEVLRNSWSETEWDPHAFLSWEPTGQVMVPVMGDQQSGLLVLSVTADGLVQDGVVELADSAGTDPYMSPTRSIVVDDRLYTVWPTGIQGNDLGSLDDLGWAPFA